MGNKKSFTFIILVLFLGIIFFSGGVFNIFKGFNNYKIDNLTYEENNSVHYKVFLKENNFFDTNYLDENKTYIISLIDYLNVDFNYEINFNKEVNGEYKYFLEATIYADKANNQKGNYWTKKFKIKDEQVLNIEKARKYNIHENLNIDYQEYNDLLNEFKKTTGVTTDAKLSISMIVYNDITGETIPLKNKRNLSLSLPLSELAIEGTVNTDDFNKKDSIEKKVRDNNPKFMFCRIVGIISCFVSLLCGILIYKIYKVMILKDYYNVKLKKILNTYDSIIVNVDNLPDLKNYNVINVSTFDELIDAHSEIRLPINFYEDKKKSYFVLTNREQAYVYRMDYRNIENEK